MADDDTLTSPPPRALSTDTNVYRVRKVNLVPSTACFQQGQDIVTSRGSAVAVLDLAMNVKCTYITTTGIYLKSLRVA